MKCMLWEFHDTKSGNTIQYASEVTTDRYGTG